MLEVLWNDAHAARHLEPFAGAAIGRHEFAIKPKGDEGAFADVASRLGPRVGREHHVLIQDQGGLFLYLNLDLAKFAEIAHGCGGHLDRAILPFVAGLDTVGAVILDVHPESLSLKGHAGVFSDKHHGSFRGVAQVKRRGDDAMVRGVDLHEHRTDTFGLGTIEVIADQRLVDDDAELAAVAELRVQGTWLRGITLGDFFQGTVLEKTAD